MEQDTIERKFDVVGPARLSLANISGSVDIQPGDDGAIVVVAEKDVHSGEASRTRIEMDQAADGSVTVKTEYGDSFWRWFGQRPCDVDYTVRVPRNCSLQLKCVSSVAMVKGLTGRLDLSAVSGDLTVADLNGELKMTTVSGKLVGERLTGPAEIDTVSGSVALTACDLESAKVSTVSGSVVMETLAVKYPCRFHSVSGGVRLVVPADTHCTVEGSSLSGRINSDLPVTGSQKSGQHWHVEIQGGGTEIRFDSISGGLRIERSSKEVSTAATSVLAPQPMTASAPAAAGMPNESVVAAAVPNPPVAAPPAPEIQAAADTRRDILDRVARGELSVDEAIKVLRG